MAAVHRPEIERALAFIAAHLEQPLSVSDVARAAHLSEFHLHRVFHAAVGESVGRFITRRRLELAALRLAYERDRSITDIALSSGYSSSSNFSKAFSAYFGQSPSEVQRGAAARGTRDSSGALPARVSKLLELHGVRFRADALYSLPPAPSSEERARIAAAWEARVRYEDSAERHFAALASPGGYDFPSQQETWRELITRARQLGLAGEAVDAWGIPHDSPEITAPELCRYYACVPCPAGLTLAPPLTAASMPQGRYAVFVWQGPVAQVADAYREVYSCWFAESSLAPADFTPYDHYVADAPRDGQIELEVWFRVRPRGHGHGP